jgi:hypothetical protein
MLGVLRRARGQTLERQCAARPAPLPTTAAMVFRRGGGKHVRLRPTPSIERRLAQQMEPRRQLACRVRRVIGIIWLWFCRASA